MERLAELDRLPEDEIPLKLDWLLTLKLPELDRLPEIDRLPELDKLAELEWLRDPDGLPEPE